MQFLWTKVVPPARPDAVVADERAEAEAVTGPIPSLPTSCWPSCAVILDVDHRCWPYIPGSGSVVLCILILRRPTIAIICTHSRQSSTVPLSSITRGGRRFPSLSFAVNVLAFAVIVVIIDATSLSTHHSHPTSLHADWPSP